MTLHEKLLTWEWRKEGTSWVGRCEQYTCTITHTGQYNIDCYTARIEHPEYNPQELDTVVAASLYKALSLGRTKPEMDLSSLPFST